MRKEEVVAHLRAEGFVVTEWSDEAGACYETHRHPQREVRVVLSGDITFVTASAKRTLRVGERIDFGPGEEHAARVGPDGATYLAGTDRS